MHIVADENIPFVRDAFSAFGEVRTIPGRAISRNELKNVEMLLVRSVTKVDENLLKGTAVEFVGTATAGIDHIETGWLKKNRIIFAYAPGSNSESVAQYVVAALIWCRKKHLFYPDEKTIGIVGVGNVGSKVARHAKTLGYRVLLCDPPRQRNEENGIFVSLERIIAESDIITLHVPLVYDGIDCTRNMINHQFLENIKPGTILINTSRGQVMNDTAVLFHRKKLSELVIDVWNNEPDITIELMNVASIATPHIAGYSFTGKLKGTEALYKEACRKYAVPATWDYQRKLNYNDIDTPISTDAEPLETAVARTYNIQSDDASLRKIAELKDSERAYYFDMLRKQYPRRYEFSHFSVIVDESLITEEEKLQLTKLGFTMVNMSECHPL